MISFLMLSTLSFSNILLASDSVSLMFSASWFMCGTAGTLVMISKSGIVELLHSLLNELEKLWESVWFTFGVSKKLSWNMICVFSMIFSAKPSTISFLTWQESLFPLSLFTIFPSVSRSSLVRTYILVVLTSCLCMLSMSARLFWFFSL